MSEQEKESGGQSQGGDGRSSSRSRRRGRGRRGQGGGGQGQQHRHPRGRSGGGRPHRPTGYDTVPPGEPEVEVRGVLQISEKGHGFLRSSKMNYNPEPDDPIVPRSLIRENELMTGLELTGKAIAPPRPGGAPVLAEISAYNGHDLETWKGRRPFKELVAESPHERINLEADPEDISTRVIDLIAPIGKGQRCLIVAPPKAGKTVLLQRIAQSITTNHPEIHLIVLLVDERPDECGKDVVVLLDSITRLARAYNSEQRGSGRVLSGGIDSRTMEKPRRFFGAARKAEDGGSLTVIATALIDTGSRMDEVIFQEFKGTGNTEIVMDRKLFELRIFPAIDISSTGTRKEEILLTPDEYRKVTLLRRALAPLKAAEAMRLLTGRIAKQPTNEAFLAALV